MPVATLTLRQNSSSGNSSGEQRLSPRAAVGADARRWVQPASFEAVARDLRLNGLEDRKKTPARRKVVHNVSLKDRAERRQRGSRWRLAESRFRSQDDDARQAEERCTSPRQSRNTFQMTDD
jgi:hypothetical protein